MTKQHLPYIVSQFDIEHETTESTVQPVYYRHQDATCFCSFVITTQVAWQCRLRYYVTTRQSSIIEMRPNLMEQIILRSAKTAHWGRIGVGGRGQLVTTLHFSHLICHIHHQVSSMIAICPSDTGIWFSGSLVFLMIRTFDCQTYPNCWLPPQHHLDFIERRRKFSCLFILCRNPHIHP